MSSIVLERPAVAPLRASAPANDEGRPSSVASEPPRIDGVSRFAAGSDLYTAGQPANALCILVSGRVRLLTGATKSHALVTGLLQAGALFGLDSLSHATHSETARAETACMVRIVPVETVDRLLVRQPGFAAQVLEALVRRRTAAERLLTRALLAGVPGRLAGALLDAAEGGVVAGLTRQQLADAAWTTRETATRVLFHFDDEGLVRVDGRRIELLDREQLRQLAAGARQPRAA